MSAHEPRPASFSRLLGGHSVTRRGFLAGSAAGALGLFLAACAGEDDEPQATASPTATEGAATATGTSEATSTATEAASAFPRTVTHALGEVELEAAPERIVAVEESVLDFLLPLGAKPVLYGRVGGYIGRLPAWITPYVEGLESYEAVRMEPDLEVIAAKTPDLIVGQWLAGDQYDGLSAVAPTASIKEADTTTWQEVHTLVGQLLGQEELAQQQIEETEALFASEGERVAQYQDLRVAVAYEFFDEFYIHGENAPIAKLVKGLGLELVAPGPDMTIGSTERWQDAAEADIILSPGFFPEDIDKQAANPLFASLPAAQNGHWVVADAELSQATYLESPLSLAWAIPRIADAIIAAAEGNGRVAGA